MHTIEPFHNWRKYYQTENDPLSPYYGKEYNYDLYTDTVYGYYLDPAWDFMGSETLYVKIIYNNPELEFAVIEFIGEWNDALNNDIMHLKRNIIDHMVRKGITRYLLIGEQVFNFHGSDDCYYEEWFDDIEDGWMAAIGFRDFILNEWRKYNVDGYFHFGGNLDLVNWRTFKPGDLFAFIDGHIQKRLGI